MKLVELHTRVRKDGRIVVPEKVMEVARLRPGDEVCVTLEDELEDRPKVGIIEEDNLHLPVELLDAAGIPEDSDLDVICTDGAIVIMGADIMDNLPDDLRELFDMLGIDPDTVRGVMRKEGYFV